MHLLPYQIKAFTYRFCILLFCFLLFYTAHSQPTTSFKSFSATIKGKVIDTASNIYLYRVTIEMKATGKKEILSTTYSDTNGFFEFKNVPNNQYQLKISFAGYRDTVVQVPVLESSGVDIGIVSLSSLAIKLKEVQVDSKKPIIEQDIDKITFHVDADPESITATALDILRKVPSLSVDAEDNLQMNGNSNYQILINGKPSSLLSVNQSDALQNIPASMMKTIEVISMPSARYEAQGVGGIINIITHKKYLGGYNGAVQVRASSPNAYSVNTNTSVTVGRVSLSGNYTYNTSKGVPNSNTFQRLDHIRQSRLQQYGTYQSNYWGHTGSTSLSWAPNERNQLTLNYNRNQSHRKNNSLQQSYLYSTTGLLTESHNNINAGNSNSNGNDFSVDYQYNFKKNEASQLIFSYRWNNSRNHNNSHFILEPLFSYKGGANTTQNTDDFMEHTLQADYVQPIKKQTIEFGVSTIRRQSNSNYFYKTLDTATNAFVLDRKLSDLFYYGENINAAYLSLNLHMGKWKLKAGARMEVTKMKIHYISFDTTAIPDYQNWMPTITLTRQLQEFSMLKVAYTQRLQRPNLIDMNPYVDLTDPQNISYGNPYLQPAITHILNFTYNTLANKTYLNINVIHQFMNNAIQQLTMLNSDTIAHTTYENIGRNQHFSLSIGSSTPFLKKMNFNINGMLNYVQYSSQVNGKPHFSKGLTYNTSGSINIRLKSWSSGYNISYNAPNILVQGKTAGYISNNMTINKYFFKNKRATISLSVYSPFQKYRRYYTEITDPNFYQRRTTVTVIRRFNLSLAYRFTQLQTAKSSINKK